jgi:hypothetical protein
MISVFTSPRLEEVKEAGLAEWEAWVIFDWCPYKRGKTLTIRDFQQAIKDRFPMLSHPGRTKLQILSKKYPDIFSVIKKKDHSRVVEIHQQQQNTSESSDKANAPDKPNDLEKAVDEAMKRYNVDPTGRPLN